MLEECVIFKATSQLCACWLSSSSGQTSSLAVNLLLFSLSIDREEKLVSLSLLPEDTGKSDVLPESLGLPLRLIRREKKCNMEKGKSKRKLSESEQVSPRLPFTFVFCFHTRLLDWIFLSFSNVC